MTVVNEHVLAKTRDAGGVVTVTLEQLEDGGLQVFFYDIGDRATAIHGDSDYEAWLTVAPDKITALAFALLREKLAGRSDALSALQAFCAENGIPVTGGVWA